MRVPRLVLPLAVGVVGAAVLLTGVAGATDLRSDQASARRAKAAAAKQQQAEAAFRSGVRPVVERVFDELQPVQDAFDAFQKPSADDLAVRDDVLRFGGATVALVRQQTALRDVPVPAGQAAVHDRLVLALDKLTTVSRTLAAAPAAKPDADGLLQGIDETLSTLDQAESEWDGAVTDVLPDGERPPPTPASRYGPVKLPREPRSKGAYLYAVDRICGSADTAFAKLPNVDNATDFLRVAPKQAALVRTTAGRLKAVPLPEGDAQLLTTEVLGPLKGFVATASALEEFASAVRKQDRPKGLAALDHLSDAYAQQAALAKAFRSYGATVCGIDLNVTVPKKSSAGSSSGGTVSA